MSPEVLVHVDMSGQEIEAGDYVVTGPDAELAKELQQLTGLWKEEMEDVRTDCTLYEWLVPNLGFFTCILVRVFLCCTSRRSLFYLVGHSGIVGHV